MTWWSEELAGGRGPDEVLADQARLDFLRQSHGFLGKLQVSAVVPKRRRGSPPTATEPAAPSSQPSNCCSREA